MSDSIQLLQELVAIPAPPGQEGALVDLVCRKVKALRLTPEIDAKGNVLVRVGLGSDEPKILVTAHLDEIGAMVTNVLPDGSLTLTNLGGLLPWKWGEGPVEILGTEPWPGIISFGSVHTDSLASPIVQGRTKPIEWKQANVFTGRTPEALAENGILPGTRIAMSRSKRELVRVGEFVSGYFLDDRADLAAWLLVLENLAKNPPAKPILFAATASEEVGGEGALFIMNKLRPDICIALELGPIVPDSPAKLTSAPTVWCKDSFASMASVDHRLVQGLGIETQFQVLSSGGSDASCAASHGLCARPVTFGIPMENTHGFEIIHGDAIDRLADLTLAYLTAVVE